MIDPVRERELADKSIQGAPPAYRDRLQRMRSTSARTRTRAGLALLARGLTVLGYDADLIDDLGFASHGRPELAGGPAFSISHSDTLVACALTNGQQVGLDVEARRDIVPERLARLMSEDESCVVAAEPPRFFDYWCAREATVKASGRVGLKRIRALTLHADRARLDGCDWPLQAIELVSGYAGCLASDRPIGAVTVESWIIPRD